MTTTIAPAQAAEQDVHEEVHPLVALLARRPELGCLAQAGVHLFTSALESA
jgi:hypothetical protein